MDSKDYVKQIAEQSDSYDQTIQAIIAFDSAVRYDDARKIYLQNSFCLPGRRFNHNPTNEDEKVTPDIAEQLSDQYGIIAEIKITASSDQDFERAEAQVRKYDVDLIGWKTKDEKINIHDLSLLIHDLNRGKAARWFAKKSFVHKLTLIVCARILDHKVSFKIEKSFGTFSDTRLEKKFIDPVAIPLENPEILKAISSVKFYDAQPPVEYTMNILWMNIFNEIAQEEGAVKEKTIIVDCKVLTKMLSERYAFRQEDHRQPKVPREAWVRQALDTLVEIDYALVDLKDKDKYHVKYSHPRKEDMIVFFAKRHFEEMNKPKRKAGQDQQLQFPGISKESK